MYICYVLCFKVKVICDLIFFYQPVATGNYISYKFFFFFPSEKNLKSLGGGECGGIGIRC